MDKLSKRLQYQIEVNGISYGELSRMTGISKSNLYRYATGETKKIPINRLPILAKALHVTPAYLMLLTDDPDGLPNATFIEPWKDNREDETETQYVKPPDDITERERRTLGIFVTPEEEQLINGYRGLDSAMQDKLRAILEILRG